MSTRCTGAAPREMSPASGSTVSSSRRSAQTSTTSTGSERVLAEEDDLLLPTDADVRRTFHDGVATWAHFLDEARTMTDGSWPTDALSPYSILVDAPELPPHLPRRDRLYGRACWKFSHGIAITEFEGGDASENLSVSHGRRMMFILQANDVVRCEVTSTAASVSLSNNAKLTGSLAVLVMCWSYILSARVLESQGRKILYTSQRLKVDQHAISPSINLDGASPALARWLCAILNSEMGWTAQDGGRLPPWSACLEPGTVVHLASSRVPDDDQLPAPSSSEAVNLLVELCRLFGLGSDTMQTAKWKPLCPYEAGFIATLMLPFYQTLDLRPKFPHPHLSRSDSKAFDRDEPILRRYIADLRYFMALSMQPISMGSILWSVFWQPDVHCNLVGPWLGAALQVLQPLLDGRQVELLVKVFVARRPKVAMWWIAVFLLGDYAILDWIRRYTEKLEEKYGYGSFSEPDPIVAAWTGSRQSFLDFRKDAVYPHQTGLVSRVDLLRCRFDLRLQDTASTLLSWRPFGQIPKELVELEVWPLLELDYSREYYSFTWYIGRESVVDYGFGKRTGRSPAFIPDHLEMRSSKSWERQIKCHVTPSKDSTCRMMSFMVQDATGGCDWGNAGLEIVSHKSLRWLRDWRGVENEH